MTQRGTVSLHLVLTVFLGLGMVLFGALAVVAYRSSAEVHTTLNQQLTSARTKAAVKQKQDDDVANVKANELPYRTYTADDAYGGFKFQIPKSWSIYAGKSTTGQTVLNLIADPDVVNQNLSTGALNAHAFDVQLVSKSIATVNKTYETSLKKKILTSKATTVSGINATWYEGTIDDERHNGVAITLPVRDKTMIITTDTRNYLPELTAILASAKINP